ncbi:hypothetical protein L798_09051 [Zootermopsis nevadensis]|uniref:Uncharacterized protein n=1 Tax=Zootermopsis nevadensis TaxID=136037 RepID=A0A067R4H3_ZOONE|nr:hypothetical protein L798_09051 [Zootermopsis nevadensis]
MQNIHETIEGIKNRDGEVIHAMQRQLTYLKTVDGVASQNMKGLATLARLLKNAVNDVLVLNRTLENSVEELKIKIALQLNISRAMRELEFTVIQLQKEFVQLQEGMETSATGRLSCPNSPTQPIKIFARGGAMAASGCFFACRI